VGKEIKVQEEIASEKNNAEMSGVNVSMSGVDAVNDSLVVHESEAVFQDDQSIDMSDTGSDSNAEMENSRSEGRPTTATKAEQSHDSAGQVSGDTIPEIDVMLPDSKKQNRINLVQSKERAELVQVSVPDILNVNDAEVIKIAVSKDDVVELDDTLVVLWTDKTSIDIRSPSAGKIKSLVVKIGDKVSRGAVLIKLQAAKSSDTDHVSDLTVTAEARSANGGAPAEALVPPPLPLTPEGYIEPTYSPFVLAGSGVRMLARDLGVDLSLVTPTGARGRTLKIDVENFVKNSLYLSTQYGQSSAAPNIPYIEFSGYGDIDFVDMSQEQILETNSSLCSWLNIPSASHMDEADITGLENFRGLKNKHAHDGNLKLTLLPFLLKACSVALKKYPQFNVSLASTGYQLIQKHYCHIGMAINTPEGMMVPVIRDVDKKGIRELAEESTDLGIRGQKGELRREDMLGGCFTVSSLGEVGGTGFIPTVNSPEVAILGVSKPQVKPVFLGGDSKGFAPRKMLPLTLSYDRRAVNGVDAGQFVTYLTQLLADIRRLVM
jgi:pyruvate dehydrogenase E2 component (dihydrolipoamide acetyltransferase)